MSFDFETVADRSHTDSQKWQRYLGRDILPMWVADMDFKCAPAIQEALATRLQDGIFGYAGPTASTIEAVVEAMDRKYGWTIEPEWLVWLPGLVRGLNLACRAVPAEGESILTLTPIYGPFLSAPRYAHRELIELPVVRDGPGWAIDWEALEAAIADHTRLWMLCNPHNPIGRVYRREELERIAELCLRHDLVICSDEIHCELILDPIDHIPLATLSPEMARRSITLMSPSKAFNTAGLACGVAIIPDPRIRSAYRQAGNGILAEVSCFGYAAFEPPTAAANPGDWPCSTNSGPIVIA